MKFSLDSVIILAVSALCESTATSQKNSATIDVSGKVKIHTPVGKDGDGLYTASTKGCFDVIAEATPLVLDAIGSIPMPVEGVLSIADYGTADAGTSLGLMQHIVDAARSRVKDKEISIQYEDQKDNEWKSVFNHALGHKNVVDAYGNELSSPYSLTNGIFVSASGTSFHEQVYPTASVDFGMSFTAMHWLSSAPNGLVGREEMHHAQCSSPGICGEAEKNQAKHDFERILSARARELKSGGKMVVVNFAKSEDGFFLGNTEIGVSMWDSFKSSWDRLAIEGHITEEERLAVSFPNYYRSKSDVESSVRSNENLRIISIQEKIVRCPYRTAWTTGSSQKLRSAREHAEWYVPTTRTWSESIFKNALDDARDDGQKDELMKRFWGNYVDIVEKEPDVHGMDYVHTYTVIEKL